MKKPWAILVIGIAVLAIVGLVSITGLLGGKVKGNGKKWTWTKQQSGTDEILIGATYGNGTFLVVGRVGTIFMEGEVAKAPS